MPSRGSLCSVTLGAGRRLISRTATAQRCWASSPRDFSTPGDRCSSSTSKAGSVTHFEADVLTENIRRHLAGRPLDGEFDGHANCFIETGFRKALLIDFNYDTEPLPGRFPAPAVGPLPLLKESHLNHIGKLMFQWFYWHLLLPGRDIPGIPSQMSMSGKHPVEVTTPPPEV